MILEYLKLLFSFLRRTKRQEMETETVIVTAEITDTPYEDAFERTPPWKTFPCGSVEEAASLNSHLTETLGISLVSRYDSDTNQLDVRIFDEEQMR